MFGLCPIVFILDGKRCRKWQFQREKLPKQEEIKEEQTGNSLFLVWLLAHSVVNSRCRTEFAEHAVLIRGKKLSV